MRVRLPPSRIGMHFTTKLCGVPMPGPKRCEWRLGSSFAPRVFRGGLFWILRGGSEVYKVDFKFAPNQKVRVMCGKYKGSEGPVVVLHLNSSEEKAYTIRHQSNGMFVLEVFEERELDPVD